MKPNAMDALSMLDLLQNTVGRQPAESETQAASSGDRYVASASNKDDDDSDSSEASTDRGRHNLGSLLRPKVASYLQFLGTATGNQFFGSAQFWNIFHNLNASEKPDSRQ